MRHKIAKGVVGLTMLGFLGCGRIDDSVFLGIRMTDESLVHLTNSAAHTDTGLRVFINGNFCEHLQSGGMGGPIDQFLKPGANTLDVEGSTASPFEITVCSYTANHRPLRTILTHSWSSVPTGGVKQLRFSVNKKTLFPIFRKGYALPDREASERQILEAVSNLYAACATSNREEFLRLSSEGAVLRNSAEGQEQKEAMRPLLERLQLAPLPAKFQFIHGKTLVFVYASLSGPNDSMTLFESRSTNSCSIAGMNFAHLGGRWVVW